MLVLMIEKVQKSFSVFYRICPISIWHDFGHVIVMWSVHFSSVFEICTRLTNPTSGKLQGVISSQNV